MAAFWNSVVAWGLPELPASIPPEALVSINQIDHSGKLADTIASHLALKISEKQEFRFSKTLVLPWCSIRMSSWNL